MYTPLYIKTENSLLSSLIKIDDLINYAKKTQLKSLAIADNNMYGIREFYQKCQQNNIKPIIGLEIMLEDKAIILYAKNYQGYQNLIKLNLIKQIKIEDLVENSKNLICIVPFSAQNLYHRLNKVFSDIYQGYGDPQEKEQLNGDNLIFHQPVLYLTKEEKTYLKYLAAIKSGQTIEEVVPIKTDHYLLSEKEVIGDLQNNYNIAQNCNIIMPKVEKSIPQFSEKDSYQLLKELCKEGLRKRFGDVVLTKYIERLKHELKIIKDMGFCDYFLIVQDYVKYAKDNNILVGPGRGSAAGSLVSYALFITDVDPLEYDLLFERFLNPERISLPDIDIDFPDNRRSEVIQYCVEKYGQNKVAAIITFGTMGAKQVIRDLGRILEINESLINQFTKLIDANKTLSVNLKNKELKELIASEEQYHHLLEIALKLEGLKRHSSIHPAGIIMSEKDLIEIVPLEENQGIFVSSYSMEYLEELGLLKMDFLGLKNLTIIQDILNEIPNKINFNEINLNDQKTINIFQNGQTAGIFQFEKAGMIKFLKELKPNSFADIYAAIALFRPGPMKNIPLFIERKNQQRKIDYFHPDLEAILKPTYGIIVYQEQIMQIASKLANYSLAEADVLRKAMSKKDHEIMAKEKDIFIQKSIANNYSKSIATKVFDVIQRFAEYGFNKAHSVSYALISYKMAYLKAHYSSIFMKTMLNSVIGSEIKTNEYIKECRLLQIKLIPPHINNNPYDYQATENQIAIPLLLIKNISKHFCQQLIEKRGDQKFLDIFDFVTKTNEILSKETFESLAFSGALDNLGFNRKTLIENSAVLLNYGQLNVTDENLRPTLVEVPEYLKGEIVNYEQNYLGFYLSEHPLIQYKMRQDNIIDLNKITEYFDKNIEVIGQIDRINIIKTKNQKEMAFLEISDEYDQISVTIFPDLYEKFSAKLQEIIKIKGRVEKRNSKWQIVASEYEKV